MICDKCGEKLKKDTKICEKCGANVSEVKEAVINPAVKKDEKLFLGIVGALIGSLVGVIAIILFDRLGFVASISGVLMSFCTIALYKKFAGSISKKGVITCIIIIIIMTLLAVNSAFSIQVVKEVKEQGYTTTFSYVFTNLYTLMKNGYLVNSTYFGSLAMVYLFTALGAFGVINSEFKSLKTNK